MVSATEEKHRPGEPEAISTTRDVEKGANLTVEEHQKTGNESDSDEFQDGVKDVRAITTVWTKKTLWSMFAL